MADNSALTTEVGIAADNATLVALLQNQYGKLEAGEARTALEATYSPVWNEQEFTDQFEIEAESPPYVSVVDKTSGARGTAMFLDSPRFYFLFNPEPEGVQ